MLLSYLNEGKAKEVKRLEAAGKYSAEAEAQTARVERANLMNIERALKKSSEAKRAELMDRFHLEAAFEADGSLKESMLKRLEAKEKSGESRFKREYYSSTLRGKEDLIEDDLRTIRDKAAESLIESSRKKGINMTIEEARAEIGDVKVFAGELSETAQKNYGKIKKALNALNEKGNNNLSMVITEANDAYKGGLVDDRTMYIPADQLENGDWAGTFVHEFTHFEEGSEEYADMVDFLQSDEILVDDGTGGKVKLADKAKAIVLDKDYGFDGKQLDAVIEKKKSGAELTDSEEEIYDAYESELAAHETEIVLGNEEFVDRIIAEDSSAAEKLVSRILKLDKGLSSMKDKQARAQAKLIKQAEKLYLKAAESAGNKRIMKMILAQRPELEEELEGEKKVQMNLYESKGSKITAEMSDSERASVLKNRTITAPVYEGQADEIIEKTKQNLEKEKQQFGKAAVLDIAKKLDIPNSIIKFDDVNVEVKISKGNIEESITKEATPIQIAKLLPILSETAKDAAVIERHNNRYYHDTDTIYFDSLMGGYVEGDKLIPVRFGLKYSRTGNTTLYVLVDQNAIPRENLVEVKKEDRGHSAPRSDKIIAGKPLSSVNYSIAQIIPFVNSKDLLRYIPDDFLNNEQMEAKKKAVAETEKYTDEKNDTKYTKYVAENKFKAAETMLSAKAKAEGYEIDRDTNKAYKASDDSIKTLDITYDDEGNLIPITKRYDSSKKDIRFNLKEKDPIGDFFADDNDGGPVYKVSGGKVRKVIADNTRMKVYTRAESEQIVNQIVSENLSFGELYGSLQGKSRREAIDMLWEGLNSADPGERGKVALDVAEYIINNAAVESIHDGEGLEVYRDTVAALKPYLHKMDLSGIKGEIKNSYGKDSSPYLLWGKRRGEVGLSPEQVASELAEAGFKIDAENPADIFTQMNDAYRDASAHLKKEAKAALNAGLTADERKKLKQDIAREVLLAFQNGGSPSKFAGIVDRYIKEAKVWREKYYAEKHRNETINRVLNKVKKLKDLKTDAFLNASEHKPHLFKGSIESLSRIEIRGNLNKSSTRKIVADLAEWYTRDNPMFEGNNLFDEEVEGMLYVISHGKGQLSTDEVAMLGDVIDYFSHFVENYNKVYRDGKYVDAKPEAERYIKIMRDNERVKVGWFGKVAGSTYLKTFGDPMTVMRRLDMYERGFYTEMMEQLREGAVGASVMEMEIREPLEEFYEKHKKFLQTIRERKVKYEGFEMTASQAMLYYMTLNRKQALAGLAKSGFAYIDDKNKTVRVPGFLKTEGMDKATLESVFQLENLIPAAKAEQEKIYSQFTDAEKQFISIAERIFNEDCKNAKREVDMKRKGFSNALEDYYVPIRRGNIAKSVDAGTFFDEMNRASNASFNKDTVRGAKNELFIESLDSVLDRHIRGVSQYANLAMVIDAYDTIFNLAVNDNPNKPETVRTVSENVWRDGAEYFKNMISDIQGIPVESRRDGSKFIRQLRSGHAKFQLGANPKTWVTQLSSFAAAGSILDIDCISRGLGIDAKDVDEYCSLAKLRNSENTVAMAQGLFDEHSKPGKVLEATGKLGDLLMVPIGKVDRFVVKRLFGACQAQIEKNGGAKVGTKANKQAAGELLQKVILETQQNATATDRSAAMRSGNELMKTITMFTADSMKVMGRVIDSVGEVSVLKARLREAVGQERAELEKRLKTAEKQAARSISSLVTSAVFMAVVAQMFRTLYNKDDEDENIAANMAVDAAGNLIGGLPIFKEIAAFFMDGYGLDNYAYSALNDLLESAGDIFDIIGAVASGELEGRELAAAMKKMAYAAGQVLGLPTRNAYNVVYGLIKRVNPSAAYSIDDMFYNQSYRSDLMRAIERGDEDMIATIAGLMLDENIGGIEDSKSRQELDMLISAGFDVIPRGVADSITYDGEEYVLGASEKQEFKKIYYVANEVLADLVKMQKYKSASDEVKAAAINYIYKVYWDLALQELVDEDLETKTVLFAEAIPIEKLALIVATASTLKADTDKSGKSISGSRKKKVQEYVNSLDLKAVEKYMIMGYLGYKNAKGEAAVKAYINKLRLTKSEKEKLIGYSGY